jgi:hypothetical protein
MPNTQDPSFGKNQNITQRTRNAEPQRKMGAAWCGLARYNRQAAIESRHLLGVGGDGVDDQGAGAVAVVQFAGGDDALPGKFHESIVLAGGRHLV